LNELSFGINHAVPGRVNGTVHAEKAAINKLPYRPPNKKPLKVSILVVRFTSSGKLGNSKCCFRCIYDMINVPISKGYKINKVYYSNREGEIIKTNLRELDSDDNKHYSRFFKRSNYRFCQECTTSDSSDAESI
jgi:hypothetical protein